MTAFRSRTAIATLLLCCAVPAATQAGSVSCGPQEAEQAQTLHYTVSQGQRMIARSWLQAMKPPTDRSFDAAGLGRFGFEPMDRRSASLRSGFKGEEAVSPPMANAACTDCQPPQLASSDAVALPVKDFKSLDFQSLVADMKNRKLAIASAAF